MRSMERIACAARVFVLLLATVGQLAAQEETSFSVTGRYTAQRRPRVTVLDFEDTNSSAQNARYGSSVQAMLVTYLKRKSQLVVVERQKLERVLEEWTRNRQGITNLIPEDPTAQQLLEKIDAIIIGNVTLLDVYAEAKVAGDTEDSENPEKNVRGPRIEIDAKLLSRADGRIIAAAQRRGPVACLRSIVERLGVALEQEFLRPYYGKLNFSLAGTENVRIYLTPILLDTALDEEKPPVERSATVIMGSERDRVEPWVTDLTTYTIENLLSGWYSMRLERPGYDGLGTPHSRWEGRDLFGEVQIYDRTTGLPRERVDSDIRRFVVRVDPLSTQTIDGDRLGLELRKKSGSVQVQARLQYLNDDYSHRPRRVVLIGGEELEINQPLEVDEYADDEDCDLFEERKTGFSDYGLSYFAAGQTFQLDTFKGGRLVLEDYRGEALPVGRYQMAVWEPGYLIHQGEVTVRDGEQNKITRAILNRETQSLALTTTGPKPISRITLVGEQTKHRIELPVDFETLKVQTGLPVDRYTASTNIAGLGGWQRTVDLPAVNLSPPIFDQEKDLELAKKKKEEEKRARERRKKEKEQGKDSADEDVLPELPIKSSAESRAVERQPALHVKTRLCVAGRLELLNRPLDAAADDLCIDRGLTRVFDLLLYGEEIRSEDKKEGSLLREIAVGVGQELIQQAAVRIIPSGELTPPAPSPAPPPSPGTGEAMNAAPREEPVPTVTPLPRDPEALRALFTQILSDVDLLLLDGRDMARLREVPTLAALVARWIESGGALYAFVSDAGDYGEVLGVPLITEALDKETDRFELTVGEVPGIDLRVTEKKVKVKADRILPRISKLPAGSPWRVVAFTRGRKDPRILERSGRDRLGYAVVWLDDPDSFRGRRGGTVPEVEAVRDRVEERVLEWARYLMYRRYDKAGEHLRGAEGALLR